MGRPPRELDTTTEPFATHPLVIIAAPDHALATKRLIRLKQLGTENFLMREEGSGTRASLEHVFRDRGATYRTSMEVSSNETIKQAVMAEMGISFISMRTVGLELVTRKLVVLDVVGLLILHDWYVIRLREKRLPPIPRRGDIITITGCSRRPRSSPRASAASIPMLRSPTATPSPTTHRHSTRPVPKIRRLNFLSVPVSIPIRRSSS